MNDEPTGPCPLNYEYVCMLGLSLVKFISGWEMVTCE